MRKALALALALSLLAGCAGQAPAASGQGTAQPQTQAEQTVQPPETEEDEEDYSTGDASLDNPRNQAPEGERELLVVSFGTSYNDNRRLSIGALEGALEEAFPDWSVRRAFTSQIIIDHVARRDKVELDNVTQALTRAIDGGVKTLLVQPTHLMDGFEYQELEAELAKYADSFDRLALGRPLLSTDEDFETVMQAVVDACADYDDGESAICLMGHGTEAESNAVYARMQELLTAHGYTNFFVGTVEAEPSVEDLLELVRAGDYRRVVLRPLMIVAGDHANNDMAGDEEDSWKSIFEGAGYEVECVLEGLGSLPAIQSLLAAHVQQAMEEQLGLAYAPRLTGVADASQMAEVLDVLPEGLEPVSGEVLEDGIWPIAVDCSSSMFRITDCVLEAEGGGLRAKLTLSSDSYAYLYPGTAVEAAEADPSEYLAPAAGENSFFLPLEALDAAVPCAAYSKKKELWYDRTLVFRSDSLPLSAFRAEDLVTARSLGLADGSYTVSVALSGGSGRSAVEPEARLTVQGGTATAQIIWSSANYDYMLVDGERFLSEIVDGHSVFEIPVAAFDRPLAVKADTTAMSQPHEIDYTLRFSSESLEPVSL